MFTPSRLTLARRRRGLTLVKLSEAIGKEVKPRALSGYERGESSPSGAVADALASALRFPRSFFDASEIEEPSVDGVSFRALTRMTAAQRDTAIAAGTLTVALNDWLTERFELPEEDVPELDRAIVDPEGAAALVRAQWGLGLEPIGNLIHLLEAHGVRVFSLADDCHEVDAFSFWHRGTPFVCLNTNKTPERSRFDAAHELGHLVLHRDGGSPRGRVEEHQANLFASAFLMPKQDVLAHAPRFPTWADLLSAKERWAVSVAALNYRLHQLEVLSDWHYRELCIEIARFGRRQEPNPMPRELSQLLAKAFGALREEGVTRVDVARNLHLYREDLEALIFGLVMTSVEGEGVAASPVPAERPVLRLVKSP